MRKLQTASVLLTLGRRLRHYGSWAGETHIQKATYVMQELLRVPTEFEFILYKHGPFSFDLRATLAAMEADGFIRWQSKFPYGPSLDTGDSGEQLLAQFPAKPTRYRDQIDFVARKLAGHKVADLEKLATALYVTQKSPGTLKQRAIRISELKPHISIAESQQAVAELDALGEEATPLIAA